MMRNTSPVGWIPLLFVKVIHDGAFVPFLIAGIFVALPLIFATVYLDSIYYMGANTSSTGTSLDERSLDKKFEWTVTSYNFLKINVLDGLSKYFGDHQVTEYIANFLPKDIFKVFYPFMIVGAYKYFRQRNTPDLVYISAFYIIFVRVKNHILIQLNLSLKQFYKELIS